MSKILVAWKDNCGMPRAWATGPAEKREEVRAAARQQLDRYKQSKPDGVGELEPFAEEIVDMPAELAE